MRIRRVVVTLVVLVAALFMLPSPALAAPELTVTPNTGLANQVVVTVAATGLPADTDFAVQECTTGSFPVCREDGITATTTSAGSFSEPFTVWRRIGDEECDLTALCEIKAQSGDTVVRAEISFRPFVQPDITVSPNTDLVPDQQVTVTGAQFLPREPITVKQCNLDAQPFCSTSTVGTADDNGSFVLPVVVQQFVNGADCLVARDRCVVLVPSQDLLGNATFEALNFRDYSPPRPDLFVQIRCVGCGTVFDDIYNASQNKRPRSIAAGTNWSYAMRLQNDGEHEDDLTITASKVSGPFTVHYFVGYYDVTSAVTGAGFTFADVAPGEVRGFAVRLSAHSDAPVRAQAVTQIVGSSALNPLIVDVVTVGVRVGS